MAKPGYLTAPLKTDKMPPGVPYIIGNEAAERFSFYGMNSILVPFMTKYLRDANGNLDIMTASQSETWYHTFLALVFLLRVLCDVPALAFGTPGIFMFIATVVFWLGRRKFVHISPAGLGDYIAEFVDIKGLIAVCRRLLVPVLVITICYYLGQTFNWHWLRILA